MLYNTRYYLTLFLLLFVCPLNYAEAKPNVQTASAPGWVVPRTDNNTSKPDEDDISYGYYLPLYDEQVNIESQTRYIHYTKEVINENGVQYNSELSVSFSNAYQSVTFHKIAVIRNGTEINKLDVSKIKIINNESDLSRYQYREIYEALVFLEDIRKGDKIDVAYSVHGFNPVFKNKFSESFTFANTNYIQRYYTSIIIPEKRKLNLKYHNNAAKPDITSKAGYIIYNWDLGEIEPYNSNEIPPSWYRDFPFVEVSEYSSWEDVAKWAYDIMNGNNYTLPADLMQLTQKWEKAADGSESVMAGKAVRFVQNEIRYLGFEIGENSHRPHAPQETYKNRYGDCKDKTVLLVTLLKQMGIDAWPVLVNTSNKGYTSENLPGSHQFDHVIVKARISNFDVWVDPTYTHQQGNILTNYLPNYEQGLIVKVNSPGIEKITHKGVIGTEIFETFKFAEEDDSTCYLDVKTIYKGGSADEARSTLDAGLKSLGEDYENYYTKMYGPTKLNQPINAVNDSEGNGLTIFESYTLRDPWERDDNGIVTFNVYSKPIYEKLTDPINCSGDAPIAFPHPIDIEHTIIVKIPSNWQITPDNIVLDRASYYFSYSSQVLADNQLKLYYVFRTRRDHISYGDIKIYREDREKMTNCLAYGFSYDQSLQKNINSIQEQGRLANINWLGVFIALAAATGGFLVFRTQNKKETSYTSHTETPLSISGWLYFLGFILVVRICIYLYTIVTNNYFSTKAWLVMNSVGATGMQLLLMFEMTSIILFLIFSCWLLYWFNNKRDLFPKMFVVFALSELGVNVVYMTIGLSSDTVNDFIPGYTGEMTKLALRSLVFCAIWVTAVLRSEKVKETFIKPYKYNLIPVSSETEEQPTNYQVEPDRNEEDISADQ